MVSDQDISDSARAVRRQFGYHAEAHALERMQAFMDQGEVIAASTWLAIAQAIYQLEQATPVTEVRKLGL